MIGMISTLRSLGPSFCSAVQATLLASAFLSSGCTCEDLPADGVGQGQQQLRMNNPKVPPQANGCLPQPPAAAPATQKLPNGGTLRISAYGLDATDNSGVAWDQGYPSPCLDDRPPRRGYPNAAWHGNYTLEGNNLCLTIDALYPHYPPKHTLRLGYTVQLSGGATFEDGSTKKDIVVHEFIGVPKEDNAKKCVTLKM